MGRRYRAYIRWYCIYTLVPKVRHAELRCSCQVLGLQEPIMLGYRDSGWGDSFAQYHPDAFVQAPPVQVVGRLVGVWSGYV